VWCLIKQENLRQCMSRVQTVSLFLTFVYLPRQRVLSGEDVYWAYIVCFISSATLV